MSPSVGPAGAASIALPVLDSVVQAQATTAAPAGPGSSVDPLASFESRNPMHPAVQQFGHADPNGGGGGGKAQGATVAAPANPALAEAKHQKRLEALARDPGAAHEAWSKLSAGDRTAVVDKMKRRYGEPFAQQFLDEVKKGKPQHGLTYWQPGTGPSREQLIAGGYRSAGTELLGSGGFEVEVWVHPSGKKIGMDVSTYRFGSGGSGPQPSTGPTATKPPAGTAAKQPDRIDPHADRAKLFGPPIAFREGVDASFGEGDVLLYKDGTAELFLDGTGGQSYLFRPLPDGGYAVYRPDGKRMDDKSWQLPKSDFPDPVADAID
jgi:hypothetical protein